MQVVDRDLNMDIAFHMAVSIKLGGPLKGVWGSFKRLWGGYKAVF